MKMETKTDPPIGPYPNALLISAAAVDPNDERCLSHLSQSLQDPFKNLQNWTKDVFAHPCQGFASFLQGATCNKGRIYKLSLSNLSLQGSISLFLSNCTNLQALDLSSSNTVFSQLGCPQSLRQPPLRRHSTSNWSSALISTSSISTIIRCPALSRSSWGCWSGSRSSMSPIISFPARFRSRWATEAGTWPGSMRALTRGIRDSTVTRCHRWRAMGFSIWAIMGIGLGSGLLSLVLSSTAVCIWLRVTEKKLENDEGKISLLMPDY